MEIVGFVDEERLNGMFLSRDITELDYVKHHSQGMLDAYFSFSADNNLPDNNTSATKFLEEENVSYGNEEDEGMIINKRKWMCLLMLTSTESG